MKHKGSTFDVIDIPEEMQEEAKRIQSCLLKRLLNMMRILLEKFMEDEDSITEEEDSRCNKSCGNGYVYHSYDLWFCFKNKGVQFLLDAVCRYLPSPLDKEDIVGTNPNTGNEITRKPDPKEPFSALAFKIATDPFVGRLGIL